MQVQILFQCLVAAMQYVTRAWHCTTTAVTHLLGVWHAGMPYPWVNLRHGVHANETVFETNTAAVGSFSIEMGLLSRLTGRWKVLDMLYNVCITPLEHMSPSKQLPHLHCVAKEVTRVYDD